MQKIMCDDAMMAANSKQTIQHVDGEADQNQV